MLGSIIFTQKELEIFFDLYWDGWREESAETMDRIYANLKQRGSLVEEAG